MGCLDGQTCAIVTKEKADFLTCNTLHDFELNLWHCDARRSWSRVSAAESLRYIGIPHLHSTRGGTLTNSQKVRPGHSCINDEALVLEVA